MVDGGALREFLCEAIFCGRCLSQRGHVTHDVTRVTRGNCKKMGFHNSAVCVSKSVLWRRVVSHKRKRQSLFIYIVRTIVLVGSTNYRIYGS
jgi:hypothetical protein